MLYICFAIFGWTRVKTSMSPQYSAWLLEFHIKKKYILQQKTYGKGINFATAFLSHYFSLLNHDYIGCLLHLQTDCYASS